MTDGAKAVEQVARAIAYVRGGKFAGPGQSIATREFGWRGDGEHLDKYADAHWKEHEQEALAALEAAERVRRPERCEECGHIRYTENEYSRTMSIEDWRRLNQG